MSAGYLTTHILDTARGCPADGVNILLYRLDGDSSRRIASAVTNADGRTDEPILAKGELVPGQYELLFEIGPYLREKGLSGDEPLFLDTVPIRFGMADADAHYHVPLLVSPYGYSTYRGS